MIDSTDRSTKTLQLEPDCAALIAEVYETLSPTDRRIADFLLSAGSRCAQMTIRTFAEHCGCSSATVVRFCRLLHLEGFADLKYRIRRTGAVPTDNDLTLHAGESMDAMLRKALQYACHSLQNTVSQVNEDALDDAARRIMAAPNVQLCAVGSASGAALAACSQLLSFGIPASYPADELQQLRMAACRKPGDVLIGINYNNAAKSVADAFMAAKAAGATTVLITAVRDGVIRRYADYVFYTPLRRAGSSLNISTTMLCQSMLLQLLMLRIWQLDPDRFAQQAERIRAYTKMKLYGPEAESIQVDYAAARQEF